MKDILESMEDAAESWADENMRGNEFKCPGCGKWFPLDEAVASSPAPYALPICTGCAGV